ncbi:MAG: hypothetical protein CMO30_17455 [Tistrella sp.]|uniref:Transposase-like Mu C-terminal domain-containing protein n=1 Tax=Tistrella mobilis TaxID=171437 RepID=A0A3B9IUB2_9PROT|nr:hypothetical protein [Tistrella sp.]MBA77058.1 hypothetical protein [Tistrella sp.]HAE51404.1 hypothetical protein [Tistrella mobilis]
MDDQWISAGDFARKFGISRQKAHRALSRAHDGHPWRGQKLRVRLSRSQGGPEGLRYEVALSDPESSDDSKGGLPATKHCGLVNRPRVSGDHQEASWKLQIVQAIRTETGPGTPARSAMIARIAAAPVRDWKGRSRTLSENTLRNWIARYEAQGFEGLMRKAREDAGQRRVVLSRELDQILTTAGASPEAIADIADQMRRRVRSEWAAGTPSIATIQMNTRPVLARLIENAGVTVPHQRLLRLCRLPRKFIEAERGFAVVAMQRNDAAAFAARMVPRIRRDRSHLRPMEWVAGDVHHVDIYFRRPDGSLCTPKMVAWMDLANNRAFTDVFILPKGEMIRREHAIRSFVNMCMDPEWGAPSRLYLDNGGEYNWAELASDIAKLKHVIDIDLNDRTQGALGTHRARAYNPQAKVIESLFSALEAVALPQLPGYIGGNRMRKKTQNQGREPIPYPGGETDIQRALNIAVAYYNAKEQTGTFRGQSPAGRFAEAVTAGWQATLLDPWELAVAFSREKTRKVNPGGVLSFEGQTYQSDALLAHVGESVLVRCPLFGDRDGLFVFSEFGQALTIATPEPVFPFGDPRGAREQARRNKALRSQVAARAALTDQLTGEDAMADAARFAAPTMDVLPAGVIRLAPDYADAARMMREAPVAKPREKPDLDDIFRRLAGG